MVVVSEKKSSGATILVADDDRGMRAFLDAILAKDGYRVLLCEGGASAREKLLTEDVDVMIADVRMPGIGGEELLAVAQKERPRTAVILITGFPSDGAVISAMRSGAARFLIKPFAASELLRSVDAAACEVKALRGDEDSLVVLSGARGWVELTAPSRHEYRDRLEGFVELLYGTKLEHAEKEDLKIAISEIVSNAVEWGSKENSDRKIRVSYCLFPEEIVFKIEDEGSGFDPDAVPDPSKDPIAHVMMRHDEGKRPGGYGLFITRKVMDKVIHSERGNAVLMSKRL